MEGDRVDSTTKRLYRSTTDRKIWGVCGGLGEYFGIDPGIDEGGLRCPCLRDRSWDTPVHNTGACHDNRDSTAKAYRHVQRVWWGKWSTGQSIDLWTGRRVRRHDEPTSSPGRGGRTQSTPSDVRRDSGRRDTGDCGHHSLTGQP